jgi:hypothetical protein
MMLLHHWRRPNRVERVAPLVTNRSVTPFPVFGSKSGAPTHPHWVPELVANPDAIVEVGTEIIHVWPGSVRARSARASDEQKVRMPRRVVRIAQAGWRSARQSRPYRTQSRNGSGRLCGTVATNTPAGTQHAPDLDQRLPERREHERHRHGDRVHGPVRSGRRPASARMNRQVAPAGVVELGGGHVQPHVRAPGQQRSQGRASACQVQHPGRLCS